VRGIPFVKMHGAGNDYVYIDGMAIDSDGTAGRPAGGAADGIGLLPDDPAELAVRIADRHKGVGSDGLILVLPSGRADARMRMFNADGSEAQMCGNGVRCVAHLVVARGYARPGPITIETGRGVLALEVERAGPRSSRVRVDMGEPRLEPADIPVTLGDGPILLRETAVTADREAWWERAGFDPRLTCVSMGNPHAIWYCRDLARLPLELFGPRAERHPLFPERTNVHVVEVLDRNRVRMRSWERGSGLTQACGTGASAVCVAGMLTGRTGPKITAEVPGGTLDLEWVGLGPVFMTGPAEEVFEGVWPCDGLDRPGGPGEGGSPVEPPTPGAAP
jgi:diaminopimelate epimerase